MNFPSKKPVVFGLLFLASFLFLTSCITTEYNVATHSQDIMLFSTEKEMAMGHNIAKKIAKDFELSQNPYHIERMQKIYKRLIPVIDRQELSYYFYVINKSFVDFVNINALFFIKTVSSILIPNLFLK